VFWSCRTFTICPMLLMVENVTNLASFPNDTTIMGRICLCTLTVPGECGVHVVICIVASEARTPTYNILIPLAFFILYMYASQYALRRCHAYMEVCTVYTAHAHRLHRRANANKNTCAAQPRCNGKATMTYTTTCGTWHRRGHTAAVAVRAHHTLCPTLCSNFNM
jgi:hypothetical protein